MPTSRYIPRVPAKEPKREFNHGSNFCASNGGHPPGWLRRTSFASPRANSSLGLFVFRFWATSCLPFQDKSGVADGVIELELA
jgi:hypothetical protein